MVLLFRLMFKLHYIIDPKQDSIVEHLRLLKLVAASKPTKRSSSLFSGLSFKHQLETLTSNHGCFRLVSIPSSRLTYTT